MSFATSASGGKPRIGESIAIPCRYHRAGLTACRPKEFVKVDPYADSDDEESNVGKMPPSDSEDDE